MRFNYGYIIGKSSQILGKKYLVIFYLALG